MSFYIRILLLSGRLWTLALQGLVMSVLEHVEDVLGQEERDQILKCHILGRPYDTGKRPPDKQKNATETVVQQAELLGEE